MPEPRVTITIVGAPELKSVPQHFWQRFAQFLRDERSGAVTFHVSRGETKVFEAKEVVKAEDKSSC